jgi:nucleoid-associated protein YgaU
MARWQWTLVGTFAFITFSIFAALAVSLLEPPAPLPTPTRTPVPTFTPTGTPRPTPILMPTRPPTATPPFTPTPNPTPTTSNRTHTVQFGETLAGIADEYGVSVEAIVELNGLTNPNAIEVGQELLIPPP